ncbi:aldo/keto reductase [Mycolicibacterium sediminis]|uniref:Oxidoreductase n=1 Tax=Mycolicibacterium sediminis TaxID=1286180 RepID=A0A7I7QLT3_9MYCO|nr:aldo/keto reductase [Mycolicibacterium sediminis]BBY27010.1 oxidoreductase [Mycolicibacterium sediminis]
MKYRTLGRRTGLRVSEYALGTGAFGAAGADPDVARALFDAFVAAGGTTFDAFNVYQDGRAESTLGELLGSDRDDFVVITKYGGTRQDAPRPGTTGNGRKTMIRSLEDCLTRLRTDHVDLFMPHFADGVTPIEEILEGLDHLIRSGKVLHGGLSNFPAWRVAGAVVHADSSGLSVPIGIETEYSLADRTADRELLPMAEAHGLGVLAYSPLAGGLLTGKYRQGQTGRLSAAGDRAEETAHQTAVVDEVLATATETGTTAVQVALAWLRHRAALAATAVIPVLGPRSLDHLRQYLAAFETDYEDAHFDRLDHVSTVEMGTPHDDVAAALRNGFDGDRSQLRPAPLPVA